MPMMEELSLTPDEIDDLLYFTRVNEVDDLQQTISDLAQKYQCSQKAVVIAGVDSTTRNTLLHYSAANGLVDLLKKLLLQLDLPAVQSRVSNHSNPLVINAQNDQGNTPLHWASYNGHLAVVKALTSAGADIWIKNAAGHNAIFEAERAEKNDVVRYLLEASSETAATSETKEEVVDGVVDLDDEASAAEDLESLKIDGQAGPSG